MRRIYSIFRPPVEQKSYADWITKCDQKLSISTKGLVAFTSSYCLNQSRPTSISYHVYIADINAPYQPYLIETSEHRITLLDWDPSGSKLLTCDARGCVTIYNSKDYLISDWKPYFRQAFSAEQFVTTVWYHQGIVTSINVANQSLKNSSNHLEYTEKIQQIKYGPSLRLFGGKAAEGCLLISRTGLVCCITLMADGNVDVITEKLSPLRTNIEIADISHNKDGTFIVGTSSGSINSTISFYSVQLSPKNITLDEVDSCNDSNRVNIVCKQHNSFHLNIMSQIFNERENTCTFERVNHIKFVSKDSPNEVLIEISGQNLSLIELWELESKKKCSIHKAILELKNSNADNANSDENGASKKPTELSKEWLFKGNYINDKELVSIQVPKYRIFTPNIQLNIIILAYSDSSICCLRKEDLQTINEPINLNLNTINARLGHGLDTSDSNRTYKNYQQIVVGSNLKSFSSKLLNGNNTKKTRLNYITDIQFSTNHTTFMAIDSLSQLHSIRLPNQIACQDNKDEEAYLQYLLEYCLITGNDWWDIMICTRQESIETICDRFHDAFERQPKHVQRKYFNRQLMIRASLYRCQNVSSSLCKSSDCHTMIMLNSIASTLKSMLRSQDQDSPAEYLSNFLKTQGTQANFFNCHHVLSKINEKELYVENDLIQSLQPLNQWVTDYAIYLISSLLQRSKSPKGKLLLLPGAGLIHNKEALEVLRELLIIIKIWGQQNEASLPVIYTLNSQVDVLGGLFRLISICYASLGFPDQLEAPFLEECIQFTNSISISQFSFVLASTGIASPLIHQLQKSHNHQQPIATPQHYSNQATPLGTTNAQPPQQPQTATSTTTTAAATTSTATSATITTTTTTSNTITTTTTTTSTTTTGTPTPTLTPSLVPQHPMVHLTLEYFQRPAFPELAPLERVEGSIDMHGIRKMDVVRNISLGAYPITNVRHCTRCNSVSLIKPTFNTTRIWEQRWMTSCVCGGSWAQSSSISAHKVNHLASLHHQQHHSATTTMSTHHHLAGNHQLVR